MQQKSFSISILNNTFQGIYVTENATAKEICNEFLKKDTLFSIDTETEPYPQYVSYPKAALSPHLSKIRLIQVFDGKNSVVFDLRHVDPSLLLKFLGTKRFIAHNAIFDLQYFIKMGVQHMSIGCTLLLAKLLVHATRPVDIGLSLEALSENVLDYKAVKKLGASAWEEDDLSFEQVEYAAVDPVLVHLLAETLAPGLEKYRLERVYKLYKDAQHAVAHMQLNGLGINTEAHKHNIETWRTELYDIRETILEYTKLDKLTGHTLSDWLETNLDPHLISVWPRTETGKLKTDAHTFADFSHADPIVELYSKYQKKDKLITSFGDNLLRLVNPETKRLHASYSISGARTGRMSCSSPNLQQLPRDETVRNIFIPGNKEDVFVSADFNQIELRCAAEISRDRKMLKAYSDGIDLHALTASVVSRKPISEVTKAERQKAKSLNFGLLFGLGSAKFSHYARMSYGVEISEEEAVKSINTWRELYSGYRAWQIEQSEKCKSSLAAYTICGKRQRLTEDNYYGTGLNHPVQGTASEILLCTLIRLQKICDKKGYRLVNCVHDEITIQCRKEQAHECKKDLEECMISGFLDVFPNGITNKLVEVKVGNSWGEVK